MKFSFREKRYAGFISYRHLVPDMQIARALQFLLEHNIRRPSRDVPRHIRPVFLDVTELPTLVSLSEGIKDALRNSDALFVVCSPNLPLSQYCMMEISYFKELHHGSTDRIFTIIVDGDPEQAFPQQLRFRTVRKVGENGEILETEEPVEPLFADVRSKTMLGRLWKLYRKEYIRLVAAYYGCSFDSLYKRHQRFRRAVASALIVAALAGGTGISLYGTDLKAAAAASRAEAALQSGDELLAMAVCSETDSAAARRISSEYRMAARNAAVQRDYKIHSPVSQTHLANYQNVGSPRFYLSDTEQQILTMDGTIHGDLYQITDVTTGEILKKESAEILRVVDSDERKGVYLVISSRADETGKITDYVSVYSLSDSAVIWEIPLRDASRDGVNYTLESYIQYPGLYCIRDSGKVLAYVTRDGKQVTQEEFDVIRKEHENDPIPEDDEPFYVRSKFGKGNVVIDREGNTILALGKSVKYWSFSRDWKLFACADGTRMSVYSTEDWSLISECAFPTQESGQLWLLQGSSYFAVYTKQRDEGQLTTVCDWRTGKVLMTAEGWPVFSSTEQAFFTVGSGKITRYDYCQRDLNCVTAAAAAYDGRVLAKNEKTVVLTDHDQLVLEKEYRSKNGISWDEKLTCLLLAEEEALNCYDRSGTLLWSVPEKVWNAALSGDEKYAAWSGQDSTVHVVDARTGKELRTVSSEEAGGIQSIRVSEKGVCISGSEQVVWLPNGGAAVPLGESYSRIALYSDGTLILEEPYARVYDFAVYDTNRQKLWRPQQNTGLWAYSPQSGMLVRHAQESGNVPTDRLEILNSARKVIGEIRLPSTNLEKLSLDSTGKWLSVLCDGASQVYQLPKLEKWLDVTGAVYYEGGNVYGWEVYGSETYSFPADNMDTCVEYIRHAMEGSWKNRTLSAEDVYKGNAE